MDAALQQKNPLEIRFTGNKQRILELLGNGVSPSQTASAMNVTESYVSQLLSEEEFALAVTARRFEHLQKHNARDDKLDDLEDQLIKKINDILPMMYKPAEILRAFQIINAAKRRGTAGTQEGAAVIANQVVNLTMPQILIQHFTRDNNNQVIEVSLEPAKQTLLPLQSQNLKQLVEQRKIQQRVHNLLESKNDGGNGSSPNQTAGTVAGAEQTESPGSSTEP